MKRIDFVIMAVKKRPLIAIISALLFFILSYYLTVLNVFRYSLSIYIQMNGFYYTIASMLLNGLISVLIGINTSILAYKINATKSACNISGGVIALFSSGCPTCGAYLFSLLGYPLALMGLPLKGLELKVVSMIFLVALIWLIASDRRKMVYNKYLKLVSHYL